MGLAYVAVGDGEEDGHGAVLDAGGAAETWAGDDKLEPFVAAAGGRAPDGDGDDDGSDGGGGDGDDGSDGDDADEGEGEEFQKMYGKRAGMIMPMFRLLSNHRQYALLFFAQVVSWVGEFLSLTATITLLTDMADNSVAVAVYLACTAAPIVLLSPVSGPVADKYSRYRVMLCSDAVCAAFVPLMLLVRGNDTLWVVYFVNTVVSSARSFFSPARSALRPLLIPKSLYSLSNSMDGIAFGFSMAAAGSAAGFIIAEAGYAACFLSDAASYAVSGLCVVLAQRMARAGAGAGAPSSYAALGAESAGDVELAAAGVAAPAASPAAADGPAPSASDVNAGRGIMSMYTDGMRYLRDKSDLLALVTLKAVGNTGMGFLDTGVVRMASAYHRVGGSTAMSMGVLYALSSVGAFAPIVLRQFDGRDSALSRREHFLLGYSLSAASTFFLVWGPDNGVFFAASAFWYAGETLVYVIIASEVQIVVADAFRGRVFAVNQLMRVSTHVAGGLMYAAETDLGGLSARRASWIGVAIPTAIALYLALWLLPRYRRRLARRKAAKAASKGGAGPAVSLSPDARNE